MMTKKLSDKVEELEEWRIEKRIEDGIKSGITRRLVAVCVTATGTLLSSFYVFGIWAYENWKYINIAVKAWLDAVKNGQ